MTDSRRPARAWLCACLLVLAASVPPAAHAADVPVIAAAANLQFAIEQIAAAFTAASGHNVRLSMGSSGNLSRQIRQAAPYQLFLAADEDYVLDLARDGFARDEGVIYATGRIVIIAPHGSPLEPDAMLDGLQAALAGGRLGKFAIANPEHAPFGRRAREALQHKGVWRAIQPHLVYGENVSQAASFATSPNAHGGIIALSLALAPQVTARGRHALIPQNFHSPLNQRMVLLRDAGTVARSFYDYLQSAPARAMLRAHGFGVPAAAR
jgi:molybdate transport system substrate-binding protein